MRDEILNKIRNRTVKVVVFGLGYVGLPTAASIAKAGFQVVGVDSNPRIVKSLSKGIIDINQPELANSIKQVVDKGLLKATSNGNNYVRKADIMIICVPTPIKEDKTPDLSYIEEVCKTIAHNLNKGKLVIVESTLPPKTTKSFIAPMLEKNNELKCGSDFWLCYCPERIAPGEPVKNVVATNKIFGGYNAESAEIAAKFYKTCVKGQIFITDSTTAELAKVAENAFRDVNIAFANELALICELTGSDVLEVIKLANTHPRVNIHTPGTGVGGACIPKDPHLLLFPAESQGFKSKIIKASRMVNDNMPRHIVNLVLKGLCDAHKQMENAKIAVLGTAYKANVGDSRLSPSKGIIQKLIISGANVTAYDPFCKENFGGEKVDSLQSAVKNADCIVIATDHEEFKEMDLLTIANFMNPPPIIVDGRRIIKPEQAEKAGINYYGIGLARKEGRADRISCGCTR